MGCGWWEWRWAPLLLALMLAKPVQGESLPFQLYVDPAGHLQVGMPNNATTRHVMVQERDVVQELKDLQWQFQQLARRRATNDRLARRLNGGWILTSLEQVGTQGAPTPRAQYRFGISADMDGATLAVGSLADNDLGLEDGSITVYRRDPVTRQYNLHSTIEAPHFIPSLPSPVGVAVAVEGPRLAAGAWSHDFVTANEGAVYMFHLEEATDEYMYEQTIMAPVPQLGGRFGVDVDLHRNWLAVGAHSADEAGVASGAAYVFNGTTFFQKLTPANAQAGDQFGIAVALTDDYLAVGAFGRDDHGNNSGIVYLFRTNATGHFEEHAQLYSPFPMVNEQFGISLAFADNVLLVGAYSTAPKGAIKAGAVYTFFIDEMGLVHPGAPLRGPGGGIANDLFGSAVAATPFASTVVVGAMDHTVQLRDDAGGIFFFE
ncbi:uncharacterized protein MONBRDRAFT_11330 [Monosiga brevicollis MX1]|uniref:Uncharacterized protein n=1 Tax=Monosiga brevicollis TaxID=81824 RepID=A9V8X3_MONBE|nr:uncharacterized protein MONBRDRAFT_11330 [Monosiga brevicollis MX1]EDQ86034.1 predicted protein [Monosiga brevicollis MX1]|eukprot:XP_001749228.1 hypothetical protein [Monosiga brevicollis MX1]